MSWFSSMKWRIFFWMVILALLPLVVVAYQGYHCARQALVESKQEHLVSMLELKAATVDAWLAKVKNDVAFVSSTKCTHMPECLGVEGGCNVITNLRGRDEGLGRVAVYDKEFKPVDSVELPTKLMDLPKGFVAELQKSHNPLVSNAQFADGHVFAFVGYPLNRQKDTEYIVGRVDLGQQFFEMLNRRAGMGKTGKVYLLSGDRKFRLSSSGYETSIELPRELAAEPGKMVHYHDKDGQPVLGVIEQIPELDSLLLVQINQDEAFAWLKVLRLRAVIAGILTLGIALIAAMAVSNSLSGPLRKLAEAAGKVARGKHDERVMPLPVAEAQAVGASFNKMLDELEATHRKVVQTASLAAVGEISSRIVHEMRNPLSSIKLNLQGLLRKVQGDEVYTELTEIGLSQVARLEKMLSGLLNYGKPLQVDFQQVDAADAVHEAVEAVRPQAEAAGISLDVSVDDAPRFFADPELLQQVLVNLLANAVSIIPEGGTVAIAAEAVPEGVGFAVTDNGPGFSDEVAEKLFRPFFTTRSEGTGLGLANVKKIVENHGGTVSAHNRPEGGAHFEVKLPLNENYHEKHSDSRR